MPNSMLVDLAREGSSEKRRELLQQVSNLFVDGSELHTDRETLLFGEVLSRLLDQVPLDDRVKVADRVSGLDRTPRDLALKLARDDARVAAPILRHSPVLTEDDLIGLATSQGQAHLHAIAQRAELGTRVTDVIVERGTGEVLKAVTRNLGAQFSERSFASLAEKAGSDHELGDALSFRADMPPLIAKALVAHLSPAARQRLEHLMAQDHEQLDALMNEARRELDQARHTNRRNRLDAKLAIADIREGRRPLDEVVDQLVFKKRIMDVAFVLSELASVPEAHVNNVLHKVNAMGIAVICRSLDMSDTVYQRLSALRCERLRLNKAQVMPMVTEYRQLDKQTADRALRFHKVRSTVGRAG
ncbi:DUF2336 domain-containing protein [Prosthecomicrobium hirschii]|uniref:DUF2336 domain-containing protein n=1 Tax=Prosthecodimorpha hirschii TaxID=665126 RepID=UPI0022200352|nr:DUF2336 domain-containing protein [Prosthecomicrobium hirschii]